MTRKPSAPLSALSAALTLVLLATFWIAFAPVQFGGQAAYVIVTGNSMEPGMHRGDLVILRRVAEYAVGDVATYRHPTIGPVIHRIVERAGDRFIFQGDNNAWLDSYEPTHAEMLGKQWIYLPSIGKIIERVQTPYAFVVLAAMMGLTIASGVAPQPTTRVGKRQQRTQAKARQHSMNGFGNKKEDTFFVLAVLALASLLLLGFAFTRPLLRSVNADLPYQQTGVWQYEAPAPPGVYDSSTVTTGEPIFRRLTSSVTVHFAYQLIAELPADARGTVRLDAEISDESGWRRTLVLQPEQSFDGTAFTASGVLDLLQVQSLVDSFEQQTALQREQYALAVVPQVVISGTLAGQPLQDQWMPRLEFVLDRFQLRPLARTDGTDSLRPAQEALMPRSRAEPNILSLLNFSLPVATARRLGMGGLALYQSTEHPAEALRLAGERTSS